MFISKLWRKGITYEVLVKLWSCPIIQFIFKIKYVISTYFCEPSHSLFKSFTGISAGLKFMGTMFFLIVWILMRRQDRRDLQLNLPVSLIPKNPMNLIFLQSVKCRKELCWARIFQIIISVNRVYLPCFCYSSAGLLKFNMLSRNRIFQIIFPKYKVIFVMLSLNIFCCWDVDNKKIEHKFWKLWMPFCTVVQVCSVFPASLLKVGDMMASVNSINKLDLDYPQRHTLPRGSGGPQNLTQGMEEDQQAPKESSLWY